MHTEWRRLHFSELHEPACRSHFQVLDGSQELEGCYDYDYELHCAAIHRSNPGAQPGSVLRLTRTAGIFDDFINLPKIAFPGVSSADCGAETLSKIVDSVGGLDTAVSRISVGLAAQGNDCPG
jgi:hypothetical protein